MIAIMVEDLETVTLFRTFHMVGFGPRKTSDYKQLIAAQI
jgi:hypothetical protein